MVISKMKCRGISQVWKCVLEIFGLLLAVLAFCFAVKEFQWQNYNDLNQRYASTLGDMPVEIAQKNLAAFDALPDKTKIWVRSYFNLTSEEYYLYQRCLIPREMWEDRILNGVAVNLKSYPALTAGFAYWKGRGAFTHPNDFITIIEEQIEKAAKAEQAE